jgi:hypothetical protein
LELSQERVEVILLGTNGAQGDDLGLMSCGHVGGRNALLSGKSVMHWTKDFSDWFDTSVCNRKHDEIQRVYGKCLVDM